MSNKKEMKIIYNHIQELDDVILFKYLRVKY